MEHNHPTLVLTLLVQVTSLALGKFGSASACLCAAKRCRKIWTLKRLVGHVALRVKSIGTRKEIQDRSRPESISHEASARTILPAI